MLSRLLVSLLWRFKALKTQGKFHGISQAKSLGLESNFVSTSRVWKDMASTRQIDSPVDFTAQTVDVQNPLVSNAKKDGTSPKG